ncbi:hypothetical protein VP01_2770g3 [Puccinia sorghi]|uniref:OTU domain-containing protein n=1 Tax=Puccinia sorghi TaxID=27349 RepID=A0A0L6V4K8_9BASI|nr:hypothetical protein VP01_2770g3 [Puccinia sorghi]
MALVHTKHSDSRWTHRCHPVLLKFLVSLVCCTLLILEVEAAFAALPHAMQYAEPARIMRMEPAATTPVSKTGIAVGYPVNVGQPINYPQYYHGQPIQYHTPSNNYPQIHPPSWSAPPAGKANPALGFSKPPKSTITREFAALKPFGTEDAQLIKDDPGSFKSSTSSSSDDTKPGSGFGSKHSSFSEPASSSASSSPRSASLQIDLALKTLKDTPITTNHLEGATWAPLDFLPGYERSNNYIGADGNCLFRAFAKFKYDDQGKYADVKTEIIEYMKNNPDKFGQFFQGEGTNLDKVNRRVAELEGGAWGDQPEIEAFVNRYEMNVVAVSKSPQSLWVNVHHSPNPAQDNFKGIVLENDHYELLRKAPESSMHNQPQFALPAAT